VQRFSESSGYFALGRTTTSTFEKYDEDAKNFVEESVETSPYTHCVFDAAIGFIGIAKKPSLAPTPVSIARRVRELLSFTRQVTENRIQVEVDPIPDPDAFLRQIREAFRITSFTATFHGPNPFDADALFQKPMSVYLAEANGTRGKTQVDGSNLDKDTLAAVTRSTAATGNDASAKIRREPEAKPTRVHLKGSIVSQSYEEETHDPAAVLRDLKKRYEEVRGNEGNSDYGSGGNDSGIQLSS